jgi:hypothetical protein
MKLTNGLIFTNIILLVLGVLAQNYLPPKIPLFYGKPFGEEQLADKTFIIFPLLLSMSVSIINVLLLRLNFDSFIKKTLVASALLTTSLATITIVKIIILVGSF